MKTGSKMLAILGLATAGLAMGKHEPIGYDEAVGRSRKPGFNHGFKSPNQRQRRKMIRNNPSLINRWEH